MGKSELFNRIRSVFGADQLKQVAQYCLDYWLDMAAQVIRTADEVCENRFLFEFEWDLEQTHETVAFGKEIDWSLVPFGDREFLWQFNRHRFLIYLGQAYQMTGNERYAVHCVRLIEGWIEQTVGQENVDNGPWRTLETGLRAEAWLRALYLIEDSAAVDDKLARLVEDCIDRHIRRLMDSFHEHKYFSNWGVLENSGLLLWSIAANCTETDRRYIQKKALERLVKAAKLQILPDGMQREQSPMYHAEVYACFRNVLYYGEKACIPIPEEIRSTVRKMACVQGIWKKPDHTQFTQGDSDAFDVRDQITSAAYIFRDPVLKYWSYDRLGFEDAWQFGYTACMEYENLESRRPEFLSGQLPFSGNYYFRNNWEKSGNLLHFCCGGTGGGHGHVDALHVDLVINGEDILVDSGRYTYVDCKERYFLKEPSAHNVVIVDGKAAGQCETSWIYCKISSCIKQGYREGENWGYVEGSHLGYIEDGLVVSRRVIWIKPDIYVIADYFYGTGRHGFENHFHFGRQGNVTLKDKTAHFTGIQTEAWLQSVSESGTGILSTGIQSLFYNELGDNQIYCELDAAEGKFHKIFVVNGGKTGDAVPVSVKRLPLYTCPGESVMDAEDGEALNILAGDREYLLVLCSQETTNQQMVHCGTCYGYGKTMLFNMAGKKGEIVTGEILEWW